MLQLFFILILVQTIFSLWPILIKLAILNNPDTNTLYIAMVKDILASYTLWFCLWLHEGRPVIYDFKGKDGVFQRLPQLFANYTEYEKILFFCLGLASAINSVGYIAALEYVTPFNASLLHPTVPVFATIIGSLLGVEKLTQRKLIGSILCIGGSIAVVLSQSNVKVSGSIFGNFLLVVQSLAMALLLVGQKFIDSKHSSLHITAIFFLTGTILSFPILLSTLYMEGKLKPVNLFCLEVILFGGVFVIAFNYAAMTYANKISSPSILSASMMLQVPLTYILGRIILQSGNQIHELPAIIAGCAIIAGLVLTIMPSKSEDQYDDASSESGILLMNVHKHKLNHGNYTEFSHFDDNHPI